jgi:hypothetical protein
LSTFYFYTTPTALHQIKQMSVKLQYQTLWRSGFPVDPWTLAEVFDIKDFGPPPEGTTNIMERWEAWERIKMEKTLEAQQRVMDFQARMQAATGQTVDAGTGGAAGNGSGIPGQAGPGRPPTGQAPPKLEQKGDGRAVVSESG